MGLECRLLLLPLLPSDRFEKGVMTLLFVKLLLRVDLGELVPPPPPPAALLMLPKLVQLDSALPPW